MPAPVNSTVDFGLRADLCKLCKGDAVKNDLRASIAPDSVLAVAGIIRGGGRGPVNGILINDFGIEEMRGLE
jgi:hypothetical protein